MAARTDTSATLGNIDVPTLLLVGEDDALTPPSVMKEMHEKIAESDLVTIPGVGHMSPVESPEVVTQNIQEFLSRSI
jgi:pimeloyl-ACP methyl ester carboxylesterase